MSDNEPLPAQWWQLTNTATKLLEKSLQDAVSHGRMTMQDAQSTLDLFCKSRDQLLEPCLSIDDAQQRQIALGNAALAISGLTMAVYHAGGFDANYVALTHRKIQAKRAERARAFKSVASNTANLVITRHGYRYFRDAPKTKRTPHNIAKEIFKPVVADLIRIGEKPIGEDAIRKRIANQLAGWTAELSSTGKADG